MSTVPEKAASSLQAGLARPPRHSAVRTGQLRPGAMCPALSRVDHCWPFVREVPHRMEVQRVPTPSVQSCPVGPGAAGALPPNLAGRTAHRLGGPAWAVVPVAAALGSAVHLHACIEHL